jgi:hypothetical protein
MCLLIANTMPSIILARPKEAHRLDAKRVVSKPDVGQCPITAEKRGYRTSSECRLLTIEYLAQ